MLDFFSPDKSEKLLKLKTNFCFLKKRPTDPEASGLFIHYKNGLKRNNLKRIAGNNFLNY